MTHRFVIEGEPRGKERARTVRQGGRIHSYTPKRTAIYEAQVRHMYEEAGGVMYETAPVAIDIEAYYGVPKSKTAEAKRRLLTEDKPTKKPDVDNIAKIICDGLNGTAYKDDKQVVSLKVTKRWAKDDKPCVKVWVQAVDAKWETPE